MLDELISRVRPDADAELRQALDEARLEIDGILEGAPAPEPDPVIPPR